MNFFDFLFEESKSSDKDLILGKQPASYKKIYNDSLKLANYLKDTIGSGKNIFILAPNSEFFLVCYLAVFKSGNVCVPLNPQIEQSNFQYIKDECDPPLGFISERIRSNYDDGSFRLINESEYDSILKESDNITDFESEKGQKDLAEIIFTSGSTGAPKGVMISHRNLIANTSSIISYLKLTSSDTIEVVMPFYYCYGLSLLHTHIRVGGSVVLNNSFVFIGSVIKDLNEHKCTGFAGVPSHFQFLLRKTKNFKTTEFPHLKYVTQAGGKLHKTFIKEFTDAFPSVKFFVMYGQTEATARLSYMEPEMLPAKLGSIGKAIPDVELQVWDENNKLAKPGKTGELIARGDNVMLGYYKDEKLTSEVLLDGYLKTGDLAMYDEDGYFYIVGRKKEMIKVRGKRVNPKEIEEVILQVPEIIDCSISSFDDDILGEAIQATVVVNDEGKERIDEPYIKNHCANKLDSYKIPSKFIFEKTMKISATGKKIKGN